MAKFIKLTVPIPSGETHALVLTAEEAEVVKSLVGHVEGYIARDQTSAIWDCISNKHGFDNLAKYVIEGCTGIKLEVK